MAKYIVSTQQWYAVIRPHSPALGTAAVALRAETHDDQVLTYLAERVRVAD